MSVQTVDVPTASANAVPAAPAPSFRAARTGPSPAPRAATAPGHATRARRVLTRGALARIDTRVLRAHLGTVTGVLILAVLLWRLGTGVFLDGLRRIDAPTLAVAVGIGAVTTVFSAWRWQLVARGLRVRLPLGPAVADYYRALFLNAALPGGVLGDVHRAVRHGRSAGDVGRGVRTVVLERVAGQLALALTAVAVLPTLPSPVRSQARHLAPLIGLALVGALAVALALRMNRAPSGGRRESRPHRLLGEAREGLLSRRTGPGVAVSSAVVLAGHLATFVVAARGAGCAAPVAVLLPLAVLALVAMGLPLNVGGFGPREGVTAWAFGAAGLGASTGLAVAVVYGVLSFAASLPGALVLVARRRAAPPAGRRTASTAPESGPRLTPTDPEPGPRVTPADPESGLRVTRANPETGPRAAPIDPEPVPGPPAHLDGSPEVSSEKYGPKESARLASSSFPFSALPREGRPMTPDSV